MELKNAAAVCLISLFSATLVVLIARSLDNQAASRLEPRLAEIVEELRAIRSGGGMPGPDAAARPDGADGELLVYYFHGNVRCPTCRSIESQTKEAVDTHFAAQLGAGKLAWKIVNYEQPSAKLLAEKYEIQMPVVVLVKNKDGRPGDWTRLDRVWALVGDKPAFIAYVRGEIERMLSPGHKEAPQQSDAIFPVSGVERGPADETPSIPIP